MPSPKAKPFRTDVTELRRRARKHLDMGAVTESYYPGPLTVRSLLPEDRMALASAVLSARQPGAPFVTLEQAYGPRCLPLLSLNKARLWARQADFRRDTIGLDPDRSAASQMQSPSISP